MTKFKGCIDIHNGQVKQIVGGSLLSDKDQETNSTVTTNFVSVKPSSYYADLYRDHEVKGTHVIKLGSSEENTTAAKLACQAWPGELQVGGGINNSNAKEWIEDNKAGKIIVTSWLFPGGAFSLARLEELSHLVGKEKLVVDLSCRRKVVNNDKNEKEIEWYVTINKWTVLTDLKLSENLFVQLSKYSSEFLIHAADVEGLCKGIDEDLVQQLGQWFQNPALKDVVVVYAGGAKSIEDLAKVDKLSKGVVDLTFGSALDIFGGKLVKFGDCVEWNKQH